MRKDIGHFKVTLPAEFLRFASLESQIENPADFLGGGDRYKIDYSAVAAKSRCVAET